MDCGIRFMYRGLKVAFIDIQKDSIGVDLVYEGS